MIWGCTGHRPQRLGLNPARPHPHLRAFARHQITALNPAPTKFVSGVALGWDNACAWACIDLGVPVIAAVPCSYGQDGRWSAEMRADYERLLGRCSDVRVVSPGPFETWKLHRRNEWIVNQVDSMLALWDGARQGGTWNCLEYAARARRTVVNVWDAWKALPSAAGGGHG